MEEIQMTAIEKAIAALEFYATSWVNNSYGSSDGDPGKRLIADKGKRAREALSELRAAQGEKVEIDKETYLIALCAWNNVPLDNAAMIKYTEENFGKIATDSWQRVYDAISAKLQLERQRG